MFIVGNYKIIFVISLFFIFIKCDLPAPPDHPNKDKGFRTTAPSRLYFKNMRSIKYELQQQGASKIDRYSFRKLKSVEDRPLLLPIIADNWINDQAYVLLEKNPSFSQIKTNELIFQPEDGEPSSFDLAIRNPVQQTKMALKIGALLSQEGRFIVRSEEGEFVPIFEDKMDKYHFSIVIKDYKRLTEQKN